MSELAVLRTKLHPPRPSRHALARPRVDALVRAALDHRVTIVQASTGYGKSTALASLAAGGIPLFWYTASEGDADTSQFLAHLITAFRLRLPDLPDTSLALLQDAYVGGLQLAVDALLNGLAESITSPSLLVIDDYHLAARQGVSETAFNGSEPRPTVGSLLDHFLSFVPPDLHVIISTRYAEPVDWTHLVSWRARGEVLDIKREQLAFNREEIAALFRDKFGVTLTSGDVHVLAEKTEGWPIALQLVWQELRAKPQNGVVGLFGPRSESLDTLFGYLAQNVFSQQSPEVQSFLLQTSVLRELHVDACRALVSPLNCRALLAYLIEHDLFVIGIEAPSSADAPREHFRYHHLFHDFLRERASRRDAAGFRASHRRAAEFFVQQGNYEEAVYHLSSAQAAGEMALLLEKIGEGILRAGRLDTLAAWLDALPPDIVATRPLLLFYLGDIARLRSRFEDALAWYREAERVWRAANDRGGISRALRGQALVYLDTVRPARAEALLQESLRLNDGLDDRVARARLLELLAENKLNMGKADEAEQLRLQAQGVRMEGPSEDALSVRVKLRTGRLDEARQILEDWVRQERGQIHPPRAHRETLLILSLVYAMQGEAERAFAAAEEGLVLAAQLGSPFVSAVGQMRLGHAYQVSGDLSAALDCYAEATRIGDQLAVPRTRAEALWGMTRAHGYGGDLTAARGDAAEGIEIGRAAGDAWIVALIQTALGASLVRSDTRQDREAIDVLGDALAAFIACGDTFGRTAARLWLALAHWHLGQKERALAHLDQALAVVLTHHYEHLVTIHTLLGWDDPRVVVPLLLQLRDSIMDSARPGSGRHAAFAGRLLTGMGLEQTTAHPGYQLRIQTLGTLRIMRGEHEITAREWQRRKARELLLLLVTYRGRMVEREQIFELLWRDQDPSTAARDFKVALNALMQVLEPSRTANGPSAFIARQESAYGLRPGADIWIDAEEFAHALTPNANPDTIRRALELYADDYLAADAPYADWAIAERERLLALYLRSTDRLASELLDTGHLDECILWCERILARDHCWEHAYRLMMRAYAAHGDRVRAGRVFEQCGRVLKQELDVEPSPATVQVWQDIRTPMD